MSHPVIINKGAYQFNNAAEESLLESALNSGLAVRYGCSNGNCGECIAHLIEGNVEQIKHSDYVMRNDATKLRKILMCTNKAISALTLETCLDSGETHIDAQDIAVKLRSISSLANNITAVEVQTPRTKRLRFFAGQSALVNIKGHSCELPIASCPCEDRNIVIHVPPGNEKLLAQLQKMRRNSLLNLNAPHGQFVLDTASTTPIIMIGHGIGLAPLRSIIEHSLSLLPDRSITITFINNDHPPYLHNLMRSWADSFDNVTYHWICDNTPENSVEKTIKDTLKHASIHLKDTINLYIAGTPTFKKTVDIMINENQFSQFAVHYLNTEIFSQQA